MLVLAAAAMPHAMLFRVAVQPPLQKYFCFHHPDSRNIYLPVLSHRGAYPDRQRRGAGCGGRGGVRRET
jgi:hypothetical protein